jgi:hypothetical protein
MLHSIVASSQEHGMISPNGTVAVEEATDKNFLIVAYAGYIIADVLVDGVSVGAVSSYEFTNVTEDHTIWVLYTTQAFNPTKFRIDLPEFASSTKYPDSMIMFYAGLADTMLNVARWGDFRPYGLNLFVAHNLVMAAQNAAIGLAGGTPGLDFGRTSSEGVGPLSASTDVQGSSEEGAGNYNATFYGTQFIRISRIVGTGGAHV